MSCSYDVIGWTTVRQYSIKDRYTQIYTYTDRSKDLQIGVEIRTNAIII